LEYREPTFEAVEIGELIEDVVVAEDHYVKSLEFALDDDSPWKTMSQSMVTSRPQLGQT